MGRAVLDDGSTWQNIDLLPGLSLSFDRYIYGGRLAAVLTWHAWPGLAHGDATAVAYTEAEALEALSKAPMPREEFKSIAAACAAMIRAMEETE